jgi:C-terminal processing protease CtpA/Prc
MRLTLLLAGFFLGGASWLAANGNDESNSQVPPLSHAEAENYTQQLLTTIREVQARYVRSVSSAEMVRAALEGLYEAAHLPVPPSLDADLEKATNDVELLALVVRVRERLGDPEPLKGPAALMASLRAMTRALDPYSGVVSGAELLRGSPEQPDRGGGLEAEGAGGPGPLRVKTVVPGGPAQRAGIRPGDQITHIDVKPVDRPDTVEAVQRPKRSADHLSRLVPVDSPEAVEAVQDLLNLRPTRSFLQPDQAKRYRLTLRRAGRPSPWTVQVVSGPFKAETVLGVHREADNAWDYYVDHKQKIAQVRIAGIGRGTAEDLRQVAAQLKADNARGLILDLRWCPGGLLDEAVNVANVFIADGRIATVKYRTQPSTRDYLASSDREVFDIPLVVLINGETSGGAELIAAALQDHHRAIVVGQRSFGKGSVQTMLPLPVANAGLKLTAGSFVRPTGKSLHRNPDSKPTDDWGVRPDRGYELPISPDLSAQLRDWWLLQSLRPGMSREVLPLDDPDNDPQRRAALRALLEPRKDES